MVLLRAVLCTALSFSAYSYGMSSLIPPEKHTVIAIHRAKQALLIATKLLRAVKKEDDVLVGKLLSDEFASINHRYTTKDRKDYTLLLFATELNSKRLCSLLLQHGAALNTNSLRCIDGKWHPINPINFAAFKGYTSLVKLFIQHGAHLKTTLVSRLSPLHLAASGGRDGIIKLLLNKGVPVDDRDYHGATPLHYAAQSNEESTVELFLEHQADYTARDENGHTPLDYATECDAVIVKTILIFHDANSSIHNYDDSAPWLKSDETIPFEIIEFFDSDDETQSQTKK